MKVTELRQPLIEPTRRTKQTIQQFVGRPGPRGLHQFVDHLLFVLPEQRVEIEIGIEQIEGSLQHRGRGTNRVVPVDFAEHDVPGKDHHLGGRAPFVGNRQTVAGLVQTQAADQALLIEVLAVGNAGMKAVAKQVIHFVDVDRSRQHAMQDARLCIARFLGKKGDDLPRMDAPIVAQSVGDFAFQQEAVGKQLVLWDADEVHVLDRMAERPVSEIMQERGSDEDFGIVNRNRIGKAVVVGESFEIEQCHAIHAERVFKSRVVGCGIDKRN